MGQDPLTWRLDFASRKAAEAVIGVHVAFKIRLHLRDVEGLHNAVVGVGAYDFTDTRLEDDVRSAFAGHEFAVVDLVRQPHQPLDAVYREKHVGRLASLAFLRLAADEVHLRQRQRVALEELVVILAIIEDGARPEVPVVTVVVVDTAVRGVEAWPPGTWPVRTGRITLWPVARSPSLWVRITATPPTAGLTSPKFLK